MLTDKFKTNYRKFPALSSVIINAITPCVALLTISMLFAACASSEKKGEKNDEFLAASDSIAEEVEEEAMQKPKLHFTNAGEAKRYMDESADCKLYSQGILYQMADDNLDYCQRLLNSKFERFIIVDKGELRVKLFDRYGRLEKSYPCAAGKGFGNKRGKGDCRTPEGFFPAGPVMNSSNWHYTDENGNRSPNPGQYGPRFFRITCPRFWSTGIHGTDAPWTIGRRCSHGCVRLKNEDILELVKYVVEGMPIIVKPGEKDIAQNERDLQKSTECKQTDSINSADRESHRNDSLKHTNHSDSVKNN